MHHCGRDVDRSLYHAMLGNGLPRRRLRAYFEDFHRVVIDMLLVDDTLKDMSSSRGVQQLKVLEKPAGYIALLDEAVGQASLELIAHRKAQMNKIEGKVKCRRCFLRG